MENYKEIMKAQLKFCAAVRDAIHAVSNEVSNSPFAPKQRKLDIMDKELNKLYNLIQQENNPNGKI